MNRDGQPVLSVEVIVSQRRSWVDLSSSPELLFVFLGGGRVCAEGLSIPGIH